MGIKCKKINPPAVFRKMLQMGNKKGFTIIEALVTLFIFSLITVTFYQIFTVGTSFIIEAKNRNAATLLANEKMEIIRNLNYDQIGTVGGIPDGSLSPDERVSASGRGFRVLTDIVYVDDSFDEVGSNDENAVMTDYKIAKVIILWGGEGNDQRVELVSRFVPPGIETGDPNEGTLVVNILSQDGGVSGANVNIQNAYTSPIVDINKESDNNGQIYLPGAEQSIQTYKITVSKSGYETVETLDPDAPGLTYSPFDKNGSVIAGDISISNITINKLANLKISSINSAGESLPDVGFSIAGGRQLDVEGNIFNISELNQSTGSTGEKIFSNISPGRITFTRGAEIDGYTFVGMGVVSPFVLNPDESREVFLRFASDELVWVAVTVLDLGDNFLEGAQVKLTNVSGYNKTLTTTEDGRAFFSDSEELIAGDYNMEVSLDGFVTNSSVQAVAEKTQVEIKLTAED